MNLPNNPVRELTCGNRNLRLDQPLIMGILNITPDSFSDGGLFIGQDAAIAHAERMVADGADIIDIGGESTRPGAADVPEQQELDRVMPVLEALADRIDVVLSIDTSKPTVMRAAAGAGAGFLNDVRALREPGALEAAAETGLPVCLMHMQGKPRSMQSNPVYEDVVEDILNFLRQRITACVAAGIDSDKLLLDPGFGFGKTLEHNITLLSQLGRLCVEAPVVIGLSRKRMIAEMLGNDSIERVTGSVAAAMLCVQRGASIVRVHDVAATKQALKIQQAIERTDDRGRPPLNA